MYFSANTSSVRVAQLPNGEGITAISKIPISGFKKHRRITRRFYYFKPTDRKYLRLYATEGWSGKRASAFLW